MARAEDTRAWIERLSRIIGGFAPELVGWEWEKAKRTGLARLDSTQNAIDKTLVAPFGARPAPGAPVSVPITWDGLDDPDLRPETRTGFVGMGRFELPTPCSQIWIAGMSARIVSY